MATQLLVKLRFAPEQTLEEKAAFLLDEYAGSNEQLIIDDPKLLLAIEKANESYGCKLLVTYDDDEKVSFGPSLDHKIKEYIQKH